MYTNCVELGEKIPCDDGNFPFGACRCPLPGFACRTGAGEGKRLRDGRFYWIVIGSIGLPHEEGETPEDLIRMLGWEESGMIEAGC